MTVFCEGEKTEPTYLKDFANEHGNQLVEIKIGDVSGVPMTLVDAAVAFRKKSRRGRRNSFEQNDQVWIACDCDLHPDLKRAFDKARANKIEVAYSNPCVEVWAILHFCDHDKPMSRGELQKALEKLMPKYKREGAKKFDYPAMATGYFEADKRAEKMEHRRREEGDPQGNPYTSMFRLMRIIHLNGKKRSR